MAEGIRKAASGGVDARTLAATARSGFSERPGFLLLAGFALAYLAGCWLAGKIAIVPSSGVSLWLPSGLYISTLLLAPRASWGWWSLAGLAAELTANFLYFHNPVPAALAIYGGNMLEALVAASLILRWCGPPIRLENIREVAALALIGILLAPMISATIGSLVLVAMGKPFLESWPLWWMGDSAGAAILTPSILLAVQMPQAIRSLTWTRWVEAGTLSLAFVLVVHLSLSGFFPFLYLTTPLVLWATLRFELKGAVLAILVLAVITMYHTVNGSSLFLSHSSSQLEALLWTEIFLAVTALLALVVAALAQQQKLALANVTSINSGLEALVDERTAELRASEQRLQTAIEAADLGTWDLDLTGTRQNLRSLRHDQMFGYKALQPEWNGEIAERHIVTEDRDLLRQAMQNAFKNGRLECEVRVRWPDRSIHWINLSGRAFYDSRDRAVRMAGVVADATRRKHAAELERRSNEVYFRLIQNNPFGIYLVDADFKLAQISVGARKAFASVDPLLGRDFAEILRTIWTEPFATEAIDRFHRTFETGEPYHSPNSTKRRADIRESETYDWRIERVLLPDGRHGVVCYFYDMTERQRYEEHVKMLMREVNHRSKNMLALVHSIARQTAALDGPNFVAEFEQRILALSASHDLLIGSGWRGVAIGALIESQLAHFKDLLGTRILASGPNITLGPAAAQTLGMALYELATNAGKYGALSNKKGRVSIVWKTIPSGGGPQFTMSWAETGGPRVKKPTRRGFGTTVIDRMCRLSLGSDITLDYAATGFKWSLACLLSRLVDDEAPEELPAPGGKTAAALD